MSNDNQEILKLFKMYRAGEISEKDLTEEQCLLIGQMYDKEIRELKASNRSRHSAVEAWVGTQSENDETLIEIKSMLSSLAKTTAGKTMDKFYLKENTAGVGLDLYDGVNYLATYLSYEDCICDMAFHWSIVDFDTIVNMFMRKHISVQPPYKYRAVVSELYCPTESVHRYVFYGNSLTALLERIETVEKRSILFPDKFIFGVQGVAIHLFDDNELKYRFWLGGSAFHSVADVIKAAHDKNKFIPNTLLQEFSEINNVDVFISHKSEDFLKAKRVYDYLIRQGISTFLSEMSLPAISNADYSAEIDKALESTKNIIVIATSKENVLSGWVQYEWSAFANEKRSGRKSGNIITLIDENMPITELPILLRQFEVIPMNNLESITKFLK